MKTSIACTALAAVAACLLATACSSSSSGTPSATGPGAPNSSKAAAATGGSTAGTKGSGAVTCKQLTYAEIQPLQTETITQDKVTVAALGSFGNGQQCVFTGADEAGAVDVLVLGGSGAENAYQDSLQGETDGPVDVPGVGDKASRDKGDDQISSIKGDVYCSVSLGSDSQVPGVAAIEEANNATSDLTEADNNTIAVALGSICNRIYGGGNTTPDLSSLAANAGSTATPSGGGLPSTSALPSDASTG